MTTVSKRRRPAPATTPSDARLKLLRRWLHLYASDPDFQNHVERFADSQAVAVEQIVGTYGDDFLFGRVPWWKLDAASPTFDRYKQDVENFAALCHLEALPDGRGYRAVHDYCLARADEGAESKHFADIARRSALRAVLKPTPVTPTLDLNLSISLDPSAEPTGDPPATTWGVEQDPATGELVAVERPMPEWQRRASRAARVGTRPMWNPRTESRGDARARILRQFSRRLDAELGRIADEHEQAGFQFRDTAPEQQRHLRWAYLEFVKGLTISEIADQEAAPGRALETTHFDNTIRDMRAALGLPPRRSSTR